MQDSTSTATDQDHIRKRFGNILRKVRKVRGKSIYELAEAASVDAGYISRLENAHRNPPSPKILQRFAATLNVPVDLLMMAAGYLEYDQTGRPLSEEEIVRKIESELTQSPPVRITEDIGGSVKSRHEFQDVIRKIDDFKRTVIDAFQEGPAREIPILGKIPAGFPVGVEEVTIGRLPVAQSGLPDDPDLFVLRVSGDSLSGAGIVEGDYVIISPMLKNILQQGSICAVRLNDDEITLKKVYFNNDGVILRAANPDYPDIAAPVVFIIGKVVRLVRQF